MLLLASGLASGPAAGRCAEGRSLVPLAQTAPQPTPDSLKTPPDLPPALVVVKDARDVVRPSSGLNPDSLSVSYKVTAPFPASEVLAEIKARLEGDGWKGLPRESVSMMRPSALRAGWRSHVLDRRAGESFVWNAQWSDAGGDVVAYTLMYKSGPPESGREGSKPDNDDLSVHAQLMKGRLVRVEDLPASLIVLDGARDVTASRERAFDQIVFDGSGNVRGSRDQEKAAFKTKVIYTLAAPRPPSEVMSTLDGRLGKQGWVSDVEKRPAWISGEDWARSHKPGWNSGKAGGYGGSLEWRSNWRSPSGDTLVYVLYYDAALPPPAADASKPDSIDFLVEATLRPRGGEAEQAAEPQATLPSTPEAAQAGARQRWEALHGEALSLQKQKKFAEALPVAQEALRLAESSFGPEDTSVARSLFIVSLIHASQGKYAKAEPLFKRGLAIMEKDLGPDDPGLARMLNNYGKLLRRMNRVAEAERMEARAKAILTLPAPPGGPAAAATAGSGGDPSAEAEAAYRRSDYDRLLELLRDFAAKESDFPERYRKAAAQGSTAAPGILGVVYEEGIGVPKDPAAAIEWFRKAAEAGDPTGQKYLGDQYRRGVGVRTNYREARKWYLKASAQGEGTAQATLGVIYQKGLGVLPDPIQAYMWFTVATAHLAGRERDGALEVRDRLSAGMSKPAIERGEQLAREWKPEAPAPPDGPGDLAWRAVDLDDALWILDTMFTRRIAPGTLHLEGEKVTDANAKGVVERLQRERRDLAGEMERVGSSDIRGDYELRLAPGDECGATKASQEKSAGLQQPVRIVQKKNAVELKGEGLQGCGVVVGDVIVVKPQKCEGTTPFRLIGKETDQGIEMTFLDKDSGRRCVLGTLAKPSTPR